MRSPIAWKSAKAWKAESARSEPSTLLQSSPGQELEGVPRQVEVLDGSSRPKHMTNWNQAVCRMVLQWAGVLTGHCLLALRPQV